MSLASIWTNKLIYQNFSAPILAGLVLSLLAFPFYIRWLKHRQIGQFIREEGPRSHAAKAMTPTTGGVVFMIAFLASAVGCLAVWHALSFKIALVIVVSLAAGAIGLFDDLAKLARRANAGISARARLVSETLLGIILAGALIVHGSRPFVNVGLANWHPFGVGGSETAALPAVVFLLVAAFYMSASTNALNLHDGMDGLAAGTSICVLATIGIMLCAAGEWPLAALAFAASGSVGGFLLFNRHPAQIFMGDTGSLFLGGLMASLVVAGGLELWFIPLALIYIVETLSVIIQVVHFKLTKTYVPDRPMSGLAITIHKLTKRIPGEGKRLFRMAPLHHHLEAVGAERGIREWQIVIGFWLVQLIICACTILIFCYKAKI